MRKRVTDMKVKWVPKSKEAGETSPNISHVSFRRKAVDVYTLLEEDAHEAVFPFFDDNLFEKIRDNIRSTEAMKSLPKGYGSDLPQERLLAVSGVRIVLRPDNMEKQADTHNKTIENYIKLALLSAGDRSTATAFLSTLIADIEDSGADEHLAQQLFWLWAPFADILGRKDIKEYLEDQAMRVLLPGEYSRIDKELNEQMGLEEAAGNVEREKVLAAEAESLEDYLNDRLHSLDIRVTISSRVKSHFSIWQKQQAQGVQGEHLSETIYDYLGFRVVVSVLSRDKDEILAGCRLVDNEIENLFERTWSVDYADPRMQRTYRAIHSTAYMPVGMFAPGTQAEFQVRSWDQDIDLQAGKMEYMDYSSKKPVPGKKTSAHVKRAKHHIYDWRSRTAVDIAKRGIISPDCCLGDGTGDSAQVLVFDKYANLHLVGKDETVLDAMFRVHSDKVFRLERVYAGEGEIDENARPINLRPLSLRHHIEHGMRLVAKYMPKGAEQLHPAWKEIVKWDEAKKKIDKRKKKTEAERYIIAGENAVKRALEVEHLGVNHYYDLSEEDWTSICNKSGLTVPPQHNAKEIMLRDIGFGDQSAVRVATYVQKKIRALENSIRVEIVNEKNSDSLTVKDGIPSARAQCCSSIAITDGDAIAIATKHKGGVMHIHSPSCSHIHKMVADQDDRLIRVKI